MTSTGEEHQASAPGLTATMVSRPCQPDVIRLAGLMRLNRSKRHSGLAHALRSEEVSSTGRVLELVLSLQSRTTMKIRSLALGLLATSVACNDAPEQGTRSASKSVLTANATQRVSFHVVGSDTLSDSARILRILPEPDGDAIIALFADPGRRISAGLAVNDRRMSNPQLLWPDSVSGVWWTGSHTLAFTTSTGDGVRLVADVHAATMKIADTLDTRVGSPPAAMSVDSSVVQRARAYIDSVHVQPGGVARSAPLIYSVTRVVPSPDGTMAAFHAAARDSSTVVSNPSWFVLDRSSGIVTPVDRVTGPLVELPSSVGEWGGNNSFYYAKGRTIWEAGIQRVTSGPGGG